MHKDVKTTRHRFIRDWLPVIVVMCIIYWMSTETFSSQNTITWIDKFLRFLVPHISSHKVSLIHEYIRKTGHFVEYFIFGLLLFRAFRGERVGPWNWRWSFWAVVLVILWAASDEFHQSFIATRTASVADVGIDTAGGVLAQFAAVLWYRHKKRSFRDHP